jgi:thymidylate synthase
MENEQEYKRLAQKILDHGTLRMDRTGTGTLSLFGEQMRFDIREHVPLLTTKFVAWKTCIHELTWFLEGHTDVSLLQQKGVKIWDGNSSRAFLDGRGLHHLQEGDIGAGYGFQWRHFGAPYVDCKTDYTGQGHDQIKEVIRQLNTDPYSRRILLNAWNVADISKMALPPCHTMCQFYVSVDPDGTKWLSCQLYQRSCDLFLGSPFNIFSYTCLTYLLAKATGMRPKELIITIGDAHIYTDHIEAIKEQLSRDPLQPPARLLVDDRLVGSEDLRGVTLDDFKLLDYNHHPRIHAKMSV